jgi:hypothetical protein
MNPKPKYIKYRYKNERLWVKVNKIRTGYVYGKIDNVPVSVGIYKNDIVKIKLSDVLDAIY